MPLTSENWPPRRPAHSLIRAPSPFLALVRLLDFLHWTLVRLAQPSDHSVTTEESLLELPTDEKQLEVIDGIRAQAREDSRR